jgi:hypothetical protein
MITPYSLSLSLSLSLSPSLPLLRHSILAAFLYRFFWFQAQKTGFLLLYNWCTVCPMLCFCIMERLRAGNAKRPSRQKSFWSTLCFVFPMQHDSKSRLARTPVSVLRPFQAPQSASDFGRSGGHVRHRETSCGDYRWFGKSKSHLSIVNVRSFPDLGPSFPQLKSCRRPSLKSATVKH